MHDSREVKARGRVDRLLVERHDMMRILKKVTSFIY
jgi:hypothetical protein